MATTPAQPPQTVTPPPQIVYVSFSAEINAHTTESLIAVMANCANQQVKEVYLMLSTPGGVVMNGLNLYNVLRASKTEAAREIADRLEGKAVQPVVEDITASTSVTLNIEVVRKKLFGDD